MSSTLIIPREPSKADIDGFSQNVDQCFQLVKNNMTKSDVKRFYPSNRMPIEDVAWDCFTSLYMRKFFDKYNYALSGKFYYLRRGIRNYLIDRERVDGKRVQPTSLDHPYIGEDQTLLEVIDKNISDTKRNDVMFMDMLRTITDREFTQPVKYRNEEARVADTSELGTVALSYFSALYLRVAGYNFTDIAKMFSVSSGYVSSLITSGFEYLKLEELGELDFESSSDELNRRMNKERKFEYTPACPKCGEMQSKNIKFKEFDMQFGKPIHVCKPCNKQFTPITDTPINGVKDKLTYIEFVKMQLSGSSRAEIQHTLLLNTSLYFRWKERTGNFYRDMGATYAIKELNYVYKIFEDYKKLGKYSEREVKCEYL